MLLEPEPDNDFERSHGLGMDAVIKNEPRDLLVQVASVAGDIHGARSRVHRLRLLKACKISHASHTASDCTSGSH